MSCHAVVATSGTSPPHRRASRKPTEEHVIAVSEAITPTMSMSPPPGERSTATPMKPTMAPSTDTSCGFWPSSGHASTRITPADVAMTVDATLEGSSWAARYTSTKNAPMLSVPSTRERHHHDPRGRRRARRSRMRPAGSARRSAPHRGASAGSSSRVTT
jgi:hypothetical protein